MEIAWCLSSQYRNEGVLTAEVMKEYGPLWAPYSVWGQAGQDNVITDEFNVARQLLSTNFHESCKISAPFACKRSFEGASGTSKSLSVKWRRLEGCKTAQEAPGAF